MKSLIIIGPGASGKSLLSRFIEGLFPEDVAYMMYGSFKRGARCSLDTKLVILEGMDPDKVENLFNTMSEGVEVQTKKGHFKRIYPRFMLTIQGEHPGVPALLERSKSASFSARFSIIQLTTQPATT